MSSFNKWKQNSSDYELNRINEKKNLKLKKRLEKRKTKIWYKIYKWLTSLEDKLLRELISNWIVLLSPIVFIAITLFYSDKLKESAAVSLNELGAAALMVLIFLLLFVLSSVYKIILRWRKKKGVYWPKYTKKNKKNNF